MRPLSAEEIGHIAPGEYLAFQAPSPQWHQVNFKETATTRVTILVPVDQTAQAWDEEIVISQLKGMAHFGIPTLERTLLDSDRKTCQGVYPYITSDAPKNGYPSRDENEMCTGDANVARISLYELTQGQNDLYMTVWNLRGKKLDGASDAQKYADTMLKPRSGLLWVNNIVCVISEKDTSCPEWYTKSLAQQPSSPKLP
jgi:hypothetical protein